MEAESRTTPLVTGGDTGNPVWVDVDVDVDVDDVE